MTPWWYPVDVRYSEWDCTLEPDPRNADGEPLIRLGFRQIRGFSEAVAQRIQSARAVRSFDDVPDLCARGGLDKRHQELLADASALRGLAGNRHRARWATAGVEMQLPLFGNVSPTEQPVLLPAPTQAENTLADYARTGLTLGPHPLRQIRARLKASRCVDSKTLRTRPRKAYVRVAAW